MLRSRRVNIVQQMETSECGLACLAMVLDFYGHCRTLTELRELCGSSRDGHTARELLQTARQLGLGGRGVATSLEGLDGLRKPAVLHWCFNHFVVLESLRHGKATIVDPAAGRRTVSPEELDRSFSGVALELFPTQKLERRRRRALSLSHYVGPLKRHWGLFLFVILANVTQQILGVGLPAASQVLIDHVIKPGRDEWLLPVMLVLCAATVSQIFLQRLQGVSHATLNASLGMVLAQKLGTRLLRLPLSFLESRSHGDLIERVDRQTDLQQLLGSAVQAIFDLWFVFLLTALMLAYDPFLGAIGLGLALLRVLLLALMRGPMAQQVAAELAARGRQSGALAEATSSVEMVHGFGAASRLEQRYARRVRERARWTLGAARVEIGLARSTTLLQAGMHATILWLGGQRVISGEMTIGVFAGFLAIQSMLTRPMASLLSLAEKWVRVRGILERCDDILCVPEAPDRGTVSARGLTGRIEVRDLGFRFGKGSPWILRNVNFRIESGQHVAFIGPSGQGKSTLGRLLSGLLVPSEGCVLLDGVDISEYDSSELAKKIGVVFQQSLIFEGPVSEALRMKDPECSEGAMVEATRIACFDSVVRSMGDGFASPVRAMGANLSGGERQRLAIAQAVLARPQILVLDEATCSLDGELEERVMRNVAGLEATVISIAHRASVVAHASRVFAVLEGSVIEARPLMSAETHLEVPYGAERPCHRI